MQKNNLGKINFVFFGTSEEAVYALEALSAKGFEPGLVITTPDRPAGRHYKITAPLAKKWAEGHGIRVFQPDKIDSAAIEEIKKENADIFIVVGYGKILPKKLINLPPHKTLNVHTSLLPRYRGPSPIETPILQGEKETGVTIIMIDEKADHGPIVAQEKYPLSGSETTPGLTKILFTRGGELLAQILPEWVAGKIKPEEQNHSHATYTEKLKKEDGLVDLNDDALKNYRKFRAYISWPRTFFLKNGKRTIITEATLEDGKFVIKKVLPEGKKEISWQEFERINTSK